MNIVLKILIILLIIINSCEFFTTRTPEDPGTGTGSFKVPLDPETVINNFKSAVNEKNLQNYINCFSDSNRNRIPFYFIPTAEIFAIYSSLFQNWSVDREKSYYNGLINSLQSETYPELILLQSGFSAKQPDSVIYITDYKLKIAHQNTTIPTEFSGRMQLTISIDNSGLWSISRWIDLKLQNDSIIATWSLAKALFSN